MKATLSALRVVCLALLLSGRGCTAAFDDYENMGAVPEFNQGLTDLWWGNDPTKWGLLQRDVAQTAPYSSTVQIWSAYSDEAKGDSAFCSGIAIHWNVILSVAHCFFGEAGRFDHGEVIPAGLSGKWDESTGTGKQLGPFGIIMFVKADVVIEPRYKKNTYKYRSYDVALIFLTRSIDRHPNFPEASLTLRPLTGPGPTTEVYGKKLGNTAFYHFPMHREALRLKRMHHSFVGEVTMISIDNGKVTGESISVGSSQRRGIFTFNALKGSSGAGIGVDSLPNELIIRCIAKGMTTKRQVCTPVDCVMIQWIFNVMTARTLRPTSTSLGSEDKVFMKDENSGTNGMCSLWAGTS